MNDDWNNMQALILCGGQGTRLKSVTGETPKVMADVDGRPFLDLLITFLISQNIRRIVLSLGYKAKMLEKYYRENPLGADIIFSTEEEPLGTGGAVKHARDCISAESFFVLNGDSFCGLDLKAFYNSFKSRSALASLAVAKVEDGSDYGGITLGDNQEILSFKEKERTGILYVNAGVYCFQKNIFSYMPEAGKFSIEKDFFPSLVGKDFYGHVITDPFFDIGTPERFIHAKEMLERRKTSGD